MFWTGECDRSCIHCMSPFSSGICPQLKKLLLVYDLWKVQILCGLCFDHHHTIIVPSENELLVKLLTTLHSDLICRPIMLTLHCACCIPLCSILSLSPLSPLPLPLPLFLSLSISLFPHSFICPSSPWQALCGQLFSPLLPQLVLSWHFILRNTGMVITLRLLLHGDTILLWLIEVPSESQRRRRSSLSHPLTGNPLQCFIDHRQ